MASGKRRRPPRSTAASRPSTKRHAKSAREQAQRLLLDTHTFLWFVLGSDRLSPNARRAIEDPANTIYVSAASVWEIAIKRKIGKLPDAVQFTPTFGAYLKRRGFAELAMTVEHAEVAEELPTHHRDPFDRMLVAQARYESIPLVSNETLFDAYNIRRIW